MPAGGCVGATISFAAPSCSAPEAPTQTIPQPGKRSSGSTASEVSTTRSRRAEMSGFHCAVDRRLMNALGQHVIEALLCIFSVLERLVAREHFVEDTPETVHIRSG